MIFDIYLIFVFCQSVSIVGGVLLLVEMMVNLTCKNLKKLNKLMKISHDFTILENEIMELQRYIHAVY